MSFYNKKEKCRVIKVTDYIYKIIYDDNIQCISCNNYSKVFYNEWLPRKEDYIHECEKCYNKLMPKKVKNVFV